MSENAVRLSHAEEPLQNESAGEFACFSEQDSQATFAWVSRRQVFRLTATFVASLLTPSFLLAERVAWRDIRQIGPFTCHTTFSLHEKQHQKSTALLLDSLPKLHRELSRTLAIKSPRSPIHLLIFSSEEEFRNYLENNLPSVPFRRALFIKQGDLSTLLTFKHPQLALDIRHEATHALLHAGHPNLPLWLDEGLAEYFEVPSQNRAFGNPHLKLLFQDFSLGKNRTLRQLQEIKKPEKMGLLEYRFSWAWVHFMLHGPTKAQQTLVHFLFDLRRTRRQESLASRLEKTIPEIEVAFKQHFRNLKRPQA